MSRIHRALLRPPFPVVLTAPRVYAGIRWTS